MGYIIVISLFWAILWATLQGFGSDVQGTQTGVAYVLYKTVWFRKV